MDDGSLIQVIGGDEHADARSLDRVMSALRTLRIGVVDYERNLQAIIAACFDRHGIRYCRERLLGPRCRIDFLAAGGVGVEVKKGKPYSREVIGQVERYARSAAVSSIVIVVERSLFSLPDTVSGKPVRYVALQSLWGVSL